MYPVGLYRRRVENVYGAHATEIIQIVREENNRSRKVVYLCDGGGNTR